MTPLRDCPNQFQSSPCNTIKGDHSIDMITTDNDVLFDVRPDYQLIEDGFVSMNQGKQMEAAQHLRSLVASRQRDVLIVEVIKRRWKPKLMVWLKKDDAPGLQIEALWILTNIAAGTHENSATSLNGVLPTLITLLNSQHQEVLEQSVWVLGNLAGESPSTRDLILKAEALKGLLPHLQTAIKDKPTSAETSLQRITTWTISNLFDGRPSFNVLVVLPDLKQMLQSFDTEILGHTCWALSHLCDGPNTKHIQAIISADMCLKLVQLLNHTCWRIVKPALRTVGNIVCAESNVDFTQHIIQCKAVVSLKRLISHSNHEIQKEACWTLSNIAAGTVEQIQCVLDSGAIPPLIKLASSCTDTEVKSEACWVVLNATSCGSDSQIPYLVKEGCIPIIRDLLHEPSMIMMSLEGLERILQVGELQHSLGNINNYATVINEFDFNFLRNHKLSSVSRKSIALWTLHFKECYQCQKQVSKLCIDVSTQCKECCKFFCDACDCTTFHKSTLEKTMLCNDQKEIEEELRKAKKKGKRQKKRLRKKVRKAEMTQQNHLKNEDDNEEEDSDDNNSEEDGLTIIVTNINTRPINSLLPMITVHDSLESIDTRPPLQTILKLMDEHVLQNDEFVSYLQNSSIMALDRKMQKEDAEDFPFPEEVRADAF